MPDMIVAEIRRFAVACFEQGAATMTTKWLTVPMAAEYCTVGTCTIRAAVKAGDLKAYAIGTGREYRLTAADIDEWLMSRAYEPPGST